MTNDEAIKTLVANYPDACFEQLRGAVDMAINALQAQEQLANNSPKLDSEIDRQSAIDADGLDEEIRCEMCENPMHTDRGCDGNCKYDEILYEKIIQILNKRITPLPSAQPETHEKRTETHSCDYIERQAAIDAVRKLYIQSPKINNDIVYDTAIDQAHDVLVSLPSASQLTGRWINDHCSECGQYVWYGDMRKYCPNCGARMEENNESD